MTPRDALDAFEANLAQVARLVAFDDVLIDFVLRPLKAHQARLEKAKANPRYIPSSVITSLENIKAHASLKAHYQALYNQWLVLLVSYFGSAVRAMFTKAIADAVRSRRGDDVLKAHIKVRILDLAEPDVDLPVLIADQVATAEGVSFQDMQSIARVFAEYFDASIERDEVVNDIVLAHASRHAIVHAAGVVDGKMHRQLRDARPRTLKRDLRVGDTLSFTPEEIERASSAMRTYLGRLAQTVQRAGRAD